MIEELGTARKILITGMVASGKTTLARKLAEESGLPLYELDRIAHPIDKSDYGRPHDEQKTVLEEIDESGSRLMEGSDR
ncbi:MAG: dephospho-CoA kinase [Spirochaetales bacterium]|nr:dephospho-CoA kinase [Spirochaetales bacterium]